MRVFVVGDIRLFREGLAQYLRRVPDVTVVGAANDRAPAVEACGRLQPDVVLVDMAMPDSMGTVRQIDGLSGGTRVVALSVPDDGGAVIACAEAGIAAYVAREGSLDDLVATLHSVMRGEARVSPRIAAALLRRVGDMATGRAQQIHATPLTEREEEIAGLVAEGLSNKQVARRLRIRLPTVKNHVHNILEKLAVGRRTDIGPALGLVVKASGARAKPVWRRSGSMSESSVDP